MRNWLWYGGGGLCCGLGATYFILFLIVKRVKTQGAGFYSTLTSPLGFEA